MENMVPPPEPPDEFVSVTCATACEGSPLGYQRFFRRRGVSLAGMAVVGAVASVVCFRTGYFVFFFLLPLALTAFLGEAKAAWGAGVLAVILNILVSLWLFAYRVVDPVLLQWNALYYSIMVLVFTWINVPLGSFFREISGRMVAGAVFCTLLFLPIFLFMVSDPQRRFLIIGQLELLFPPEVSDVSTAEKLLSGMVYMGLRGGTLLSCLVFWWVNRQFALLISRIFQKDKTHRSEKFLTFRAPFFLIWVLSLSLGAVLMGRTGKIEALEIAAWNLLVLSAILFLVQGGAVILYFLSRFPPLPRILISVGTMILLFRPGVNLAVLGLLVLLGIAENWIPFRTSKQQ